MEGGSRQAGWWLGLVGGAMRGDRGTASPGLAPAPFPARPPPPPGPGGKARGERGVWGREGQFVSLVIAALPASL